jgi:glycosyltransferase involved in cell wall biosynthesis
VTNSPLVSVIVPAHNAAGGLPALLGALERQTLPRDCFEVIVVDDGSTDATAELVEASPVGRLVRRSSSGGSYAARNDGVAVADGRVLAFTDADCVPADSWLERGLERARSGQRMIAGHVEVPLGPRPTAAALVDVIRFLDQQKSVARGFAATANLWLDADVLARVGPFNDRIRSGGDLEFGNRARAAGEEVVYASDVVVTHEPRSRRRELARKAYRLGHANAEQRRHAVGELGDRACFCLQPGNYVPYRRLWGIERLEGSGVTLTRRRLAAMHVTQYLWMQLPMIWGSVVGSLRVGRGGSVAQRELGAARSAKAR